MTNIVRSTISVSELRTGMTVEYENKILTVGSKDVKYDSFMGYSFRGDASKRTITLIQFAVPTLKAGVVLR